jgi:hypothetical protein
MEKPSISPRYKKIKTEALFNANSIYIKNPNSKWYVRLKNLIFNPFTYIFKGYIKY